MKIIKPRMTYQDKEKTPTKICCPSFTSLP